MSYEDNPNESPSDRDEHYDTQPNPFRNTVSNIYSDETDSASNGLQNVTVLPAIDTDQQRNIYSTFNTPFSTTNITNVIENNQLEIIPESSVKTPVILDNCLLLKVNRHISGYDGTICTNPVRVMCGAPEYFRQMYCDKGEYRCFDLSLFNKDGYTVRKPADEEYTEFLQSVTPGNIMLFWTNRPNFNYLVGIYVVERIERRDSRDGMLVSRPYYQIYGNNDLSVRFVDGLIDSSPVWNRSVRSETYSKYIRKTDRSAIIPILQNIQEKHELRGNELRSIGRISEAEQCDIVIQKLAQIIENASEIATPPPSTQSYSSTSDNGSGVYTPRTISVPQPPTPKANRVITAELNKVIAHLKGEKLYYPDELIYRYHISLMSKPFVILTGVSGGGKTRLTQVYADAMGGKYCLVSVRPDWQSNESLLGSYDILNKRFVPTEFCRHVHRAYQEWQKAQVAHREPKKFFVCLDEMNLSRAEYYFSDFLSRMEVAGELRKVRLFDQPVSDDDEVEQDLIITPNLYITGTVNLDETTHTFSRKVLDRANIIKIDRIEIGHMLDLLREDYGEELLNFVGTHLKEINLRLAEAGQQFGYRTVREILDWVNEAYQNGLFSMAAALDIEIVQKVLVRLEVSSDHNRQSSMLEKLTTYFEQETRNQETDKPLFERSYEVISELTSKLQEEDIVIGQL